MGYGEICVPGEKKNMLNFCVHLVPVSEGIGCFLLEAEVNRTAFFRCWCNYAETQGEQRLVRIGAVVLVADVPFVLKD